MSPEGSVGTGSQESLRPIEMEEDLGEEKEGKLRARKEQVMDSKSGLELAGLEGMKTSTCECVRIWL